MKRHRGLNHCSGHPKLMQYYKSAILQLRYTHTHTHTQLLRHTHTHKQKFDKHIDQKKKKKRPRNLKCVLFCQKSQSEKHIHSMTPTIRHSGKGKTREVVKEGQRPSGAEEEAGREEQTGGAQRRFGGERWMDACHHPSVKTSQHRRGMPTGTMQLSW